MGSWSSISSISAMSAMSATIGEYSVDDTAYQRTLRKVQSFKMSVPDSHQQLQSDINPDNLDARSLYQQENLRLNTIHSLSDVKKHFNQQS